MYSGWLRTTVCTVSACHWTHFTLKHKFLIPNVTWAICPFLIRHGWVELERQTFAPLILFLRWLVTSFNRAKCWETSRLNSAIFSFSLQQESHGPALYVCLNVLIWAWYRYSEFLITCHAVPSWLEFLLSVYLLPGSCLFHELVKRKGPALTWKQKRFS